MWCSDTGSWSCWTVGRCWGAPCPAKALPFWTRAEPVEPGSILQALPPPLHSLLLRLLHSPFSSSSLLPALPLVPLLLLLFPRLYGCSATLLSELIKASKRRKKREKALNNSTWAYAFFSTFAFICFSQIGEKPLFTSSFLLCNFL